MSISWFFLMLLVQGAVLVVGTLVIWHVLGNLVGLVTRGVWRSPIEDRDAIWDWAVDFWRDHIEPAAWAEKRRQRRRAQGQCVMCGYSLVGNESGTCPECGTATTYGSNPGEPGSA